MPRSKTLTASKPKSKKAAPAAPAPSPKHTPKVVQRANADSDEESDEDEDELAVDGEDVDSDEDAGSGSSEEEDSDEDGVDEEGMARLMNALGDEGLDEFERAQLGAITGDGSEDEDEEEGSDEESGSDDEVVEGEDAVEDDEEEEEGVELDGDDVSIASDVVDLVPKQKIQIDNADALDRIRETIALPSTLPWTETLTTTYPLTHTVDVSDDLNRELSFYKQALHSATTAKTLAEKHSFPFTRPTDYFAEMVKSDAHMQRIRSRLLDEQAGFKKSEEARKIREGKKFGKQVQVERTKERVQARKEMEERVKGLKRKRKNALDPAGGDEDFDVAVEDALADRPAKRAKSGPSDKKSLPRHARDKKFGFGSGSQGGRRSKQNDRDSTDTFGGGSGGRGGRGGRGGGSGGRGGGKFGAGGGRGGAKSGAQQRPGKARRHAAKRG
ncbi:Ebp2-domain-containing protein [Peniophora sp. CONT]|nr:Ebp2-domain-containing protein [Peniophora sp. CONT]